MSLLATADPTPAPADPAVVADASLAAASASPALPAWIQADGTFAEKWTEHVPEDMKASAIALQKFKDPMALARSYVHAEQQLGKKVAPPTADSTPEQKAAWNKIIGVPDSPDGYQLKPAKLPEGVEWNEEAAKGFQTVAHELGLTPQQAQRIAAYDAERQAASGATDQQEQAAFQQTQITDLRKEYGDGFDSAILKAKTYCDTIGLPHDHPALMHADVVKALVRGAGLISESKLVRADGAGNQMTNAERQRSMSANPADPWHKAYTGQEGAARQEEAVRIYRSLNPKA
jgi:hypothetical protein